jgi:hypothetical protein
MTSPDPVVTLVPYFTVQDGKLAEFRALMDRFVAQTKSEPGCVHYAFSVDGQTVHCREGYDDAKGLLAHLENVGAILGEALKISSIARLEVHGPADQLDALRGPLANLNPQWFVLGPGFRR